MLYAPRPGFQYRHTQTHQLVPPEGQEVDVCDLDIVRAIECGDLVAVKPGAKKSAPKAD